MATARRWAQLSSHCLNGARPCVLILGFVVLGGALLLEFKVGPPVVVHVIVWGLLTPLVAFFLLRVLKATLIALQFKHKAEEGRLAPPD